VVSFFLKVLLGHKRQLILITALQLPLALATIWTAFLIKAIIDSITQSGSAYANAQTNVIIFISLILLQSCVQLFSTRLGINLKTKVSNTLQLRLMEHIQALEFKNIQSEHGGKFLTLITSDVDNVAGTIADQVPRLLKSVVICVGATIAVSLIYPPFLLAFAIFVPFIFIYNKFFGRKMKALHIEMQEKETLFRNLTQDILGNVAVIKAFGNANKWIAEMAGRQQVRTRASIKKAMLSNIVTTALSFGGYVAFILILFVGAGMVRDKAITFGALISFIQLVSYSTNSIRGIATSSGSFASCLGSASRIMGVLDLSKEPVGEMPEVPTDSGVGVRFLDVTFKYENNPHHLPTQNVLENLSFEILPRQMIGIVGASGVGKSTLANLIMSFYKPQSGVVLLKTEEGMEFEVSSKTRNVISYVPQGNTVISGTIRDNILMGAQSASDEEVKVALELAGLCEILDWPEGLETQIGEKGTRLSAGQAQRVCLARAFVRTSRLLILDEATSNLDIATEMQIIKSLHERMTNRTIIIITHRLEALEYCDKVFRLDNFGKSFFELSSRGLQ